MSQHNSTEMSAHPLAAFLIEQTGHDINQFLTPIKSDSPAGEDLLHSSWYHDIRQARRADDPSLPRSSWETDLKQADWGRVSGLCIDVLINHSKDLQVAIWLLEAQLQRFGFAGLAPTLMLIEQLCLQFWQPMYPSIEEDLEYRVNLFVWVNEKLVPVLKQITINDQSESKVSWEVLELAVRNEQLKASQKHAELDEGLTLNECQQVIASTSTDYLLTQLEHIDWSLGVLDHFKASLEELCGEESPSMGLLQSTLDEMGHFMAEELTKRGINLGTDDGDSSIDGEADINGQVDYATGDHNANESGNNRTLAYAQIEEIAAYLAHIEPHSPVPYLLRRMVEWGNMSTADLYQQLFIQNNGQIDIFEVLGLQRN